MKKSITEKLGLSRLWEVLIVVALVAFSYTFILYLFDRFTVFTGQYTFPRFVIIIVLTIIFYNPFYSPKIILRFKYLGSIFFIYFTTIFLTNQGIIYFDQTLKTEFVEFNIQQQIENDQNYLAKKGRTLDVENSYAVIRNSAVEQVSFKRNFIGYLISLVIYLLICYVFAYFFTFKSFKEFNSYQN
jgi:hypothetical protein